MQVQFELVLLHQQSIYNTPKVQKLQTHPLNETHFLPSSPSADQEKIAVARLTPHTRAIARRDQCKANPSTILPLSSSHQRNSSTHYRRGRSASRSFQAPRAQHWLSQPQRSPWQQRTQRPPLALFMQRFIAESPAHQPDCQTERPSNRSAVCPSSQDYLCPAPQRPGENFECLRGETLNASLRHCSSIHPSLGALKKPENFHCLFHINTSLEVSVPQRDRTIYLKRRVGICLNTMETPRGRVYYRREGCQSVSAAKTSTRHSLFIERTLFHSIQLNDLSGYGQSK